MLHYKNIQFRCEGNSYFIVYENRLQIYLSPIKFIESREILGRKYEQETPSINVFEVYSRLTNTTTTATKAETESALLSSECGSMNQNGQISSFNFNVQQK